MPRVPKGGFRCLVRQEYRFVVFAAAIFGVSTVLVARGYVAAQQKMESKEIVADFSVRQSVLSQPVSFPP